MDTKNGSIPTTEEQQVADTSIFLQLLSKFLYL